MSDGLQNGWTNGRQMVSWYQNAEDEAMTTPSDNITREEFDALEHRLERLERKQADRDRLSQARAAQQELSAALRATGLSYEEIAEPQRQGCTSLPIASSA